MFDAEEIIAEGFAGVVGFFQCLAQTVAELRLRGGTLHARLGGEVFLYGDFQFGDIDTGLLQDGDEDATLLFEQCLQHVRAFQLGVAGFGGEALRLLQGFLEFLCKFIESHGFGSFLLLL